MSFLDGKTTRQKELETKIKVLRDAGMNASADRLDLQLNRLSRTPSDKIKPMSPQELAKQVKEQKALGKTK